MFEGFVRMPLALKFLVLLGLLTPVLAVLVVSDNGLFARYVAEDRILLITQMERGAILALSLPICAGAFLISKRSSVGQYIYLVGWFLVSLSPLVVESIRTNLSELALFEITFNAAIGLGVLAYMKFSASAKSFISNGSLK